MELVLGALVVLVAVFAMAAGSVFFKRKPIEHCGSSSIMYKGKRIDCPICQGCDLKCDKADA